MPLSKEKFYQEDRKYYFQGQCPHRTEIPFGVSSCTRMYICDCNTNPPGCLQEKRLKFSKNNHSYFQILWSLCDVMAKIIHFIINLYFNEFTMEDSPVNIPSPSLLSWPSDCLNIF